MDAWMDVHRAVARLSNADTAIFLTDSAVGAGEEEGMAHLAANLGPRAVRERIVPFLTLKHPLDYCLRCAARARRERFPALVVLGGDKRGGPPRCLPHAFELREDGVADGLGGNAGGIGNEENRPAAIAVQKPSPAAL